MAFAPSGTRRDIIFQSLKGKGKEHLEAYSKLTASWILITRRTKVDSGLPGTKEGSFPLTNSSPGLPALHRGRRRKENERARKRRAPACSQDWQEGGETDSQATHGQHLGKIIVIQGLDLLLASPELSLPCRWKGLCWHNWPSF